MKFGFLYWTPYTAEYPAEKQFEEILELARSTRDAGFDLFAANHSYFQSPLRAFQPLPLLARLATETGDMDLLTGIFLLALHNPVDIAEQTATLDIISGGRLIFGVGVGTQNLPCEAFGINPKHRGARTGESLQIIKRLWTEDDVTYEGQHFSLTNAKTAVKPIRKPYPPIWVGASARRAIRRAARLGDAWYTHPQTPFRELKEGLEYYNQCLEDYGGIRPAELPLRRDIYIAADHETAMREGKQYLGGPMSLWNGIDSDPDRFFMGSPDMLVDQIGRYQEHLGEVQWVFRMQWPGIPHSKVMNQVELLGSRVIPQFR
jgi:alkanesulfonate monooxygenase SsuD/methylene tetrahydromethanopterin reductase-like flavin-dependent oxidoreductase (luciferase family)